MFDRAKLQAIAHLIRLDRPIGSILLLAPTLWALWLVSNGTPNPKYTLIFIIGVFIMRSVGCAINDWFDRDIDPQVERTKTRPLANGTLNGRDVLTVIVIGLTLALILLLQLPKAVMAWSIPAIILTFSYPLFKRFTHFPQAVLGLAFTWSIPMVFAAHDVEPTRAMWYLLFANFIWVLYYDTAYAMSDREDDEKVGVKSTAIFFGKNDVLILGILQIAVLVLLILVGQSAEMNQYYYLCLILASGFFIYQRFLYQSRERWACFRAFVNNGWFGMTVFLGFLIGFN